MSLRAIHPAMDAHRVAMGPIVTCLLAASGILVAGERVHHLLAGLTRGRMRSEDVCECWWLGQ